MKHFFSWIVVAFMIFCSCSTDLSTSFEYAGENRTELETVLEHFKKDPNPLKYEAAQFLIENMPYHMAFYGSEAEKYQNAYTIMAKNAQDFRDSVVKKETSVLNRSQLQKVSDIRTVKADYLIKFINKACDTWEKVNWNKDYDKSLFFNYVLPYRMNDELLSDWHEEIDKDFSYIYLPIVYSEKGVQYPAYKQQIANAKVADAPDALKGKVVRMEALGVVCADLVASGSVRSGTVVVSGNYRGTRNKDLVSRVSSYRRSHYNECGLC